MTYQVKLEQFTGPLAKLLELIEERQLEITTINIAEVTADFIKYTQTLEEEGDPHLLADFLVVASHLVLIKSKTLLPSLELTQEEESNIHDLEARLKLYKEFKQAAQHVGELWSRKNIALARPLLSLVGDTSVFYPPKNLAVDDMAGCIGRLFNELKEFLPDATQKIKRTIVSLEKKMQELIDRFQTAMEHSFKSLTQSKSKQEIVVLFLALLHLAKSKIIKVEQSGQFGDIILRKQDPRDAASNSH
ncbi:MAG: segregation/condensation protein A [bacterium]|nr:segregation/condensation protein A [bacterium]